MIKLLNSFLERFKLNIVGLIWFLSSVIYYIILCAIPTLNPEQKSLFVLMTLIVAVVFIIQSILIIYNIKKYGKINRESISILILTCILGIIINFAIIYQSIYIIHYGSFKYVNELNGFFDRFVNWIYFSVITFTSLGYGDIVPVSNVAKIFVSIEAIMFTVIISFIMMNFTKSKENKEKDTHQNEENNNE